MNSVFNRRLHDKLGNLSSNHAYQSPRQHSSPTGKHSPQSTDKKGFMRATASSQQRNSNIITQSRRQVSEDSFDKLKHNILRFTRSSDRRMLLRTLTQSSYLSHVSIPLQELQFPSTMAECKSLDNEVMGSMPVIFNGMELGASDLDEAQNQRAGKTLLMHLRILCNKSTSSLPPSDTQISSDELYYDVLMRLAPSRGISAAFQRIYMVAGGSKDLVVERPKIPIKPIKPTSLILYVTDGQVHCVVQQHHAFGLYRKSDAVTGKPWIGLTASTHERVNLSTGAGVRELHVQVHEERFLMY